MPKKVELLQEDIEVEGHRFTVTAIPASRGCPVFNRGFRPGSFERQKQSESRQSVALK